MDAIEVTFESIDVSVPEAAEGSEPRVDFPERFGPEAIEAALPVDGSLDEAGIAEDAEVLGDGGLGHAEVALDLSDGLLGGDQEGEDGAAAGLGNNFERGIHALYIPHRAYACQGI